MRKLLVIGGSGMLGQDVCIEASKRGYDVINPSHAELDITDAMHVAELATGKYEGAEWCINCSAYTAVDKAESEVGPATELNHLAPASLALACGMSKIRLLHISTDFVFDGQANQPYQDNAPTNPLGVYGRTKRDGEEAIMRVNPRSVIVRTSWLFGPNGNSFPRTMIRAFESGRELRVVADQVGCPTYTGHLARVLIDLTEKPPIGGIFHATGLDTMSWHEFAIKAITAWTGSTPKIEAIPTEAYPTPAQRPKYSVLSNSKLAEMGIDPMPKIDAALQDFCHRLREQT